MKRIKRIHDHSILGQRGINLIATIVSDMGYMWTPTTAASDAGIDGFIEIRQRNTGEATNPIVQVQSRATGREWINETDSGFDYRCDARDLDYWLQGNAPVILVVSRPDTKHSYWISIKDYFRDLERLKSKIIHFDKNRDVFNVDSASGIANLAKPKDSGLYLAPPPISEQLQVNLLPVSRYAQSIYTAESEHRERDEVREKLRDFGLKGAYEWFLKEGKIVSFYNLREELWSKLCDSGTVEKFATDEWALSMDPVKHKDFVRLLNSSLQAFLSAKGIWRYQPDNGYAYYFFAPSRELTAEADGKGPTSETPQPPAKELPAKVIKWKYRKESERTVFRGYYGKKDPTRIVYYRHVAFEPKFHRFACTWYLEITPTYHFTSDGTKVSNYADSYLAGIKRIEKHGAVHANVQFWAYVLTDRSLFTKSADFLTFSDPLIFHTNFGIPESDWLNRADEEEKERLAECDESQILLFDED